MSIDELTETLVENARRHAAEQKLALPRHSCSTTKMSDLVEQQFQAAFLAGASAVAVLGMTPTEFDAAIAAARKRLGLSA